MHRDGTLEKHDVKPSLVKDELLDWMNSDEGLWFTSRYLIKNTRLVERVHKPVLMWVQKRLCTPDTLFSVRDPRASGKTDGITIAIPMWSWGADPIQGTAMQGVNTCIVLVAPKKDLASFVFLANVQARWDICDGYHELCPWVQMDPRFWSLKNGFRLKRTLLGGLPNLMPLGMESVSTSLHPPVLICDDPIHEQNYRSHAEVRKVTSWVEHSHSLTVPVHGVRGFIGNYWTMGDVQDQFHPDQEDCAEQYRKIHVWERGLTGCETCLKGETVVGPYGGTITGRIPGHEHEGPTIPVALGTPKMGELDGEIEIEEPVTYIEDVRAAKPTFIFLTQHENKLIDPANLEFEKDWLKFWDWDNTRGELAISVSPHLTRGLEGIKAKDEHFENRGYGVGTVELLPLHEFDFYMLLDPAPSEEASLKRSRFAAALLALHRLSPRQFLIDEYAKNAKQHLHIAHALDWFIKWRIYLKRIGIESVGYQATIKDTLLETARIRGIVGLNEKLIENLARLRSEGAQLDRIKYTLIPILEARCFHVHKMHRIFMGEYDTFGLAGSKHDLLDAISNVNRVAGPRHTKRGDAMVAAEVARQRRAKVSTTGY